MNDPDTRIASVFEEEWDELHTPDARASERERWVAGTKALAQLVADEGDDFSDLATNALVPPLTADHGWRCECGVCDQTRLDEWSDR